MSIEAEAQNEFQEDEYPVYTKDGGGEPSDVLTGEQLVLDIDGYDGPLDILLTLARDQKVDLTQISILDLANQYLDFIETAKTLRIELAADYLVMASWLAYLKSCLLVPKDEVSEDAPSGEQMAEALAFHLKRLEGMRDAGERLIARPVLGTHFFGRGAPDGLSVKTTTIHEADMYDLLTAYGDIKQRNEASTYTVKPFDLMSVEQALERIQAMLGRIPGDWMALSDFIPGSYSETTTVKKSAMASTFGATLEMAKQGLIAIKQENLFAPIYIKQSQDGRRTDTPDVENTAKSQDETHETS